jgi:hypothetical protein
VKVHCDEGVAIHVAPDPCAGIREDVGEASVGERIGQPLSRETVINPGADVVHLTEGKIGGRVICERPSDPAWSETLACTDAPCAGTGRSLDRPWALLGSDGP